MASMERSPARDETLESLTLLVKEAELCGRWLHETLEALMQALRTGRSPQVLKLEEMGEAAQGVAAAFGEALQELEGHFQPWQAPGLAEGPGAAREAEAKALAPQISQIKMELEFCKKYQEMANTFLRRLQMVAKESQISPLGRMPLEDVWEELEACLKNAEREGTLSTVPPL